MASESWMKTQAPDPTNLPAEINPEVPSIARVYDYFLGGKDNFPADRAAAAAVEKVFPQGKQLGWESRMLLRRATRNWSVPVSASSSTSAPACPPPEMCTKSRTIDPEVRVVYIDNDPVVLAHGRALLADEVTTTVVQADLRHPDGIFDNPEVRALLDFDQPVAVFLASILHHFGRLRRPVGAVPKIRDRISSGSYMLITHFYDSGDPVCREVEQALLEGGLGSGWFRTKEQIERFFEGMDVLEPGVVAANEWRPDAETPTDSTTHHLLAGGLARKP